jgi:hypothetical protein
MKTDHYPRPDTSDRHALDRWENEGGCTRALPTSVTTRGSEIIPPGSPVAVARNFNQDSNTFRRTATRWLLPLIRADTVNEKETPTCRT